jgi:hypothetical protein
MSSLRLCDFASLRETALRNELVNAKAQRRKGKSGITYQSVCILLLRRFYSEKVDARRLFR